MDFIEIILDALLDSLKMLPFLYATFLLMEFIEHKAGDKLAAVLEKAGHSPLGGAGLGAALGCIPQCGFSVAAANLYASRVIGAGTLMAVFIATSDEAVPVLLAHPDMAADIWALLGIKVITAVVMGCLFGFIMKKIFNDDEDVSFEEICTDCGCGKHGIWYSAMTHTLKTFLFVLLVNLALGLVLGIAGEDRLSLFLDGLGIFEPFAAALVGLIPNCASSVVLTELYAEGAVSFGTAAGGLCAGAGMGIAMLFKANRNMKENFAFLIFLFLTGGLSGMLINTIL